MKALEKEATESSKLKLSYWYRYLDLLGDFL